MLFILDLEFISYYKYPCKRKFAINQQGTMTMTNTKNMISPKDEEDFIIDALQSARHALELHKAETSARRFKQNQLEKQLEDAERTLIDYMLGNGLIKTDRVTLGETESVDAPDVDAIPNEFVRVKTVREPNKILIKEVRPDGANWYSITKNYKVTIRA